MINMSDLVTLFLKFLVQIQWCTTTSSKHPSLVKSLEHGHRREATNLDLCRHPFPCHLGINDKFVPNLLLNLRFVPMCLIEHFVVLFDPNGPQGNAPKKVTNFNYFTIFLGDPFPEQSLLPVETIIVASSNPAKFMHNKCGPSPCLSGLNANPKICV